MPFDKTNVYISYAWEDELTGHNQWVRDFAEWLESCGISAWYDGDEKSILYADRILVIGTPEYKAKVSVPNSNLSKEYEIIRFFFRPAPVNKVYFILKNGTLADSIPEEVVPYVFNLLHPDLESYERSKLLSLMTASSSSMQERVQQLIVEGRLEEALPVLSVVDRDAILLQAQFNQAKKQYSLGLVDFGEWSRVQSRITHAALNLASRDDISASIAEPEPPSALPARNDRTIPQVFISYNHQDEHPVIRIREYLEANGCKVYMDKDMPGGTPIETFIDEGLRENNFFVAIISANSLSSGWANREITAGFLAQRIVSDKKHIIPAYLDEAFLDTTFYSKAMDKVDAEITSLVAEITKSLEKSRDIRFLTEDLARQRDLQANLGTVIGALKKVKVLDMSPRHFETGLKELAISIKNLIR